MKTTQDKPLDQGSVAIRPEGELQVAMQATAVLQEIQGAIILAKKFPRDYKTCFQNFNMACKRKALALKAEYQFPRGKTQVKGASVNIARVGAQCWGNVRWGFQIVRDDETSRSIIGWAWDIEMNNKVEEPATFKKLIYRKNVEKWVVPDERDLRELTNRHAAICMRNCILQILPRDYVDDAIVTCRETLTKDIEDLRAAAKEIISEFGDLGITVDMLNNYLGHDQWIKSDIVDLRAVLNAIQDGQAKPQEFFDLSPKTAPEATSLSAADMSEGDAATHQGYEKQAVSPDEIQALTSEYTRFELIELLTNELVKTFQGDVGSGDGFLSKCVDDEILKSTDLKKNTAEQLAQTVVKLRHRQKNGKAGF